MGHPLPGSTVMRSPVLLLAASMALAALPARSQDALPGGVEPPPPPPSPNRFSVLPEQWQKDIPPSEALDVPRPVTRDGETQRATLQEAIGLALENNPGIAAKRLEPVRVGEDILEAQAQYDPVAGGVAQYTQSITPNANALAGTRTTVLNDRFLDANIAKLFRTGTRLTLDFNWDRLANNGQFFQLRPQYTPETGFSLVQPLLRDFGWDFSYLVVRVAERTTEGALYQYEANVADFVKQVIDAYFSVMGARANVQVFREAEALAQRTVEENKARVKVGLLPPVAILEAQADASARHDDVIRAENLLEVSRQQLAQLCFYRPDGTFVPRTLEPAEYEGVEEVRADLDETLDLALEARPEIHASAKGVQARQLTERITSNALLPRLDVVGGYAVNGLAGKDRANATQTSRELVVSPTDLGNCQFLGPGAYLCPVRVTTGTPPSPFAGTKGDAFDRMASGSFKTYNFGVQLSVPLDNAAAKAQHTRSRIELNQSELNHRELLSQVTLEVRQSVADVLSSRQRIDASRVARELAEENLRSQQKRYEVGMATTKDLLDFQQRLTSARAAEVQANFDYAVAVAAWRRAQGALLEQYHIVLQHPKLKPAPWFAKF
jgi:outer membrane protein TolC